MTLTLRIEHDTDPESPRDWDNLGTMVCWHRRYKLGDEQPNCRPDEFEIPKGAIYLPLYLYDHSGITMNTIGFSCPWDSGQVGWIYVTREKVLEEYGWDRLTATGRKQIETYLRSEVETYDQYLQGDVWGYVIEDEDGEQVDSCWGFYGREYAEQEAATALEYQQSLIPQQADMFA